MQCHLSSSHYQLLAQSLLKAFQVEFVRGSQQDQEATVKMEAMEGISYLPFWKSAHGQCGSEKGCCG